MPYFPAEPLKEEEWPYAARLGAAIIQWNATEQDIRQLLFVLAAEIDPKRFNQSWLMIIELGSRQLSQALQVYAEQTLEGEEAKGVEHVATWFDQLGGYRNYYVHGIVRIRPVQPRTGLIESRSAKGKLLQFNDEISIEQLEWFIDQARQLRSYVQDLQLCLIDTRHYPGVAKPLPDRPPLPGTLLKRRASILARATPPQS